MNDNETVMRIGAEKTDWRDIPVFIDGYLGEVGYKSDGFSVTTFLRGTLI